MAESRLQAILGELDLGDAELGFRAHIPEVQVKLGSMARPQKKTAPSSSSG